MHLLEGVSTLMPFVILQLNWFINDFIASVTLC